MGLLGVAAVFADGMGLCAVGIATRGRSWRVVAGSRAERIRGTGRRWYCGNADRAQLLVDAGRGGMECLPPGASIQVATATLTAIAADLGIVLVAEDRIREQAECISHEVEAAYASLQDSGEMKNVNRSYREYRLRALAAGDKPIGYPTFISNYKTGLLRAAAQRSRIAMLENGRGQQK